MTTLSCLLPHVVLIQAIARFCEAIIDFLADEQRAREASITAEQFHGEVFAAYEQLFNIWLQSKEAKVSCYTLYCVCPFITSYTVPICPTFAHTEHFRGMYCSVELG